MTLWLADHRRFGQGAVVLLRFLPALFSHLLGVCGGVNPTLRESREQSRRKSDLRISRNGCTGGMP